MARCALCYRRLAPGSACPNDGLRVAETLKDELVGEAPASYPGSLLLGVGGFATTWSVEHEGQRCALKWARRDTLASRQRFELEAEHMRHLPLGLAPALLAAGQLEGRAYLLLEQLPSGMLAERLEQRRQPLASEEFTPLARAICSALELLHGAGLAHRDLKPENLFWDGHRLRLIDFGVAAPLGQVAGPAGTPEYAAPEQLREGVCHSAADVYALGSVLYELVTLRLPFVGEMGAVEFEHATLRPPKPSRFASLSTEHEALILRCLAKNPEDRPTLKQLQQALSLPSNDVLASATRISREPKRQASWVLAMLVSARISLGASELADLAMAFGSRVAAHQATSVLLVWPALATSLPDDAANACADELASLGAKDVFVHAETVGHLSGSDTLFGAVLEDRSWCPSDSWTGVRQSAALRALFQHRHGAPRQPFVGQETVVQEVLAVAQTSLAAEQPALISLLSPEGGGKSRLLEELAASLRARCPGLDVHRVCGPMDIAEGGEGLIDRAFAGPLLVLVDDAHALPSESLDALEFATLSAPGMRLVVLVAAELSFASSRPRFGRRAPSHLELRLPALSEVAAGELMRGLLKPAEYIPEETIARLYRWCGQRPGAMEQLAVLLHNEGYVQVDDGPSAKLDTKRLEALPQQLSYEWLASGLLRSLPTAQVALARLCALLPAGFSAETLEQLCAELDDSEGLADASVGLPWLQELGLLSQDAHGYHFRSEATRQALASQLGPTERQEAHRWAYQRANGSDMASLVGRAHHAAALGLWHEAAESEVALGDMARAQHRAVDAERHYSRALAQLDLVSSELPLPLRLDALMGCGWSRYRIDRAAEAVTVLREAAALANALALPLREAECILEEATALDWAQRFEESRQAVERARPLCIDTEDARCQLQYSVAVGRSHWRSGHLERATQELLSASEAAAALGDFDNRVVALLLLGPALVLQGSLDAAEARFEELIALCVPANDRLHLCAAYGNRMFLWSARKQPERAREDLREAMRLAQQIGHPGPERVATYNLSEDLYWSGEDDKEAHRLALRSCELAERFLDLAVPEDALLVARTALALGEKAEVQERLAWVASEFATADLQAASGVFVQMLKLSLLPAEEGETEEWNRLLRSAEGALAGDDLLEVLYWACRVGSVTGWSEKVEGLLAQHPIWMRRFASL